LHSHDAHPDIHPRGHGRAGKRTARQQPDGVGKCRADDRSREAEALLTSYGREGVCMNVHGKGTWVACNYNMRENRFIRFWSVDVDRPTNSYRNWSQSRRVRI
jgi:hypothetical protein